MRPLMLQRLAHEGAEPFRQVLAAGTADDVAAILRHAAPAIGGTEAVVVWLSVAGAPRSAALAAAAGALEGRGVRFRSADEWPTRARDLLAMIAQARYDLVLKAIQPRADGGLALDALDRLLIDRCPCPVWFGLRSVERPPARVVAAVAPGRASGRGGPLAWRVLSVAVTIADRAHADLHVVHASVPFGAHLLRRRMSPADLTAYLEAARTAARQRLAAWLQDLPADLIPARQVHVFEGELDGRLAAFTAPHDLVVIGTRGRRGRFESAVNAPWARRVMGRVQCPVLVVRA